MSVRLENNPQYYSSITDKYYDTYESAVKAEIQVEAMELAPATDLHGIVQTYNACLYNDDQSSFGQIELWIRRLVTMHDTFAAETCSYATIGARNNFLEAGSLNHYLRVLIRMDRIGDRGELIGQIDRFLKKFYPELYAAYYNRGGILNVNSGTIAVFGCTVPSGDGTTQYQRFDTPILRVDKLFEYHLTRFQEVLRDSDFLP